jgi:predicted transcriptional regulator
MEKETKPQIPSKCLTKKEIDAIQNFERDYNEVDQFLRNAVGTRSQSSFTSRVKEYRRSHPRWVDADLLHIVADIRNAIVHYKTHTYQYVAVPGPEISKELRACRQRLLEQPTAIKIFGRDVTTVERNDSLATVLRLIGKRDFSQFPVYDHRNFHGLLTENGITRWLAEHVTRELSLVELDEVHVKEVLGREERRPNYCFVARDTRVDDVRALFETRDLLEAALVTEHGKESETLLGIATRWDVQGLDRRSRGRDSG